MGQRRVVDVNTKTEQLISCISLFGPTQSCIAAIVHGTT